MLKDSRLLAGHRRQTEVMEPNSPVKDRVCKDIGAGVPQQLPQRSQRDYSDSPYLFFSERGAAMAAHTARGIIERAEQLADIPFPVHPHMLRHAYVFYLASKGRDTRTRQAYLGLQKHSGLVHVAIEGVRKSSYRSRS